MLQQTTHWWSDVLGSGRAVPVEEPKLLAHIRAGLVYVTEATNNPTRQGLSEFLFGSSQEDRLDAYSLDKVWSSLNAAEEHFSAQAKLPGYQDIPRPGDVFAHFRHAWPIGHPRQSENVTPIEASTS